MRNRVFFPQGALDEWMATDRVEIERDELTMVGENRRFRIAEAVRVLREVAGAGDEAELIGKVKSKNYLTELGAELLEESMILGDAAYDVVPGFVGAPIGSFEEHRASIPDPTVAAVASSDEELLATFLSKAM